MNREMNLLRPDQIKEYLDGYVIGQDEAKKTLAVAVYNHYKRIEYKKRKRCKVNLDKSNIILMGDTGCGKTLLVKTLAQLLNVPCYIGNATSITESGYVGDDIETLLTGLLRECNYETERAQYGIVFIDEGDKLAKQNAGPSITKDVSGEGVQQGLLKMLEGHRMGVPPFGGRKHPEQPLIEVDTTDILFILSGAFVGLDEIVARRLGKGVKRIGFSHDEEQNKAPMSNLDNVTPEDLKTFGFIPEFIGRFPVITHVEPLDKAALVRILTEPTDCIVEQYRELLREDGVNLKFDPGALDAIAEAAVTLGTGARALRCIMEKLMRDVMYNAPMEAELNGKSTITIKREDVLPALQKDYKIDGSLRTG
ncbi:MAG: ATP-dependent Clp protease ATP-binding subunit ClpX [Bacteroidales bacterium]|nr:ATP-dependent Clp protease ATP-binding subunit ClpX [Bacteroidales bacterium]